MSADPVAYVIMGNDYPAAVVLCDTQAEADKIAEDYLRAQKAKMAASGRSFVTAYWRACEVVLHDLHAEAKAPKK